MTYVIIRKREFYGSKDQRSLVCEWTGYDAPALRFTSIKEAKAHIEMLDNRVYYADHNESSRPTYTVKRADRLPQYLARDL